MFRSMGERIYNYARQREWVILYQVMTVGVYNIVYVGSVGVCPEGLFVLNAGIHPCRTGDGSFEYSLQHYG